jgi:hypothetical protein
MKTILKMASIAFVAFTYNNAFAHTLDLQLQAGGFDIFDSKKDAFVGGIELRKVDYNPYVIPKMGAMLTEDSARYFYAGFDLKIQITPQVDFVPGIAAGIYKKGDGKTLGGAFEFYSKAEIMYNMINRHAIGISFGHISNAHVYSKNPGAETLLLTYKLPIF